MSKSMVDEETKATMDYIAEYHDILRRSKGTYDKGAFYDRFSQSAMTYGEASQGIVECHPGAGESCYCVKSVDVGETFTTSNLVRPFLLNAATLDAIWQGILGATSDSTNSRNFGFDASMLPTSINELEVSLDMPGKVGCIMPALCRSRGYNDHTLTSDICTFDGDLTRTFLTVSGLVLIPLEIEADAAVEDSTIDSADITSEVRWEYSLDLLHSAEINRAMAGANGRSLETVLLQVRKCRAVSLEID